MESKLYYGWERQNCRVYYRAEFKGLLGRHKPPVKIKTYFGRAVSGRTVDPIWYHCR